MNELKIVMTGGGSGGHITPILAVAEEVKSINPEVKIIYIGQTGDPLGDIPQKHASIDEVYTVRAGKFRRYHTAGAKQLLDLPTLFKNIRDALFVVIGFFQSLKLLHEIKPNIIFVKGGFVGVPVGLSAAILRIPYITHDSDSLPGLANRIIAPWARIHAVALPKEIYSYNPSKTVTTGIPLQANFVPVTDEIKRRYRNQLKIPTDALQLFIIGGGQGAQRINSAVCKAVPHLMREFTNLYVVHGVGRTNEDVINSEYAAKLSTEELSRLSVFGYSSDVYMYSGSADVIITRAGATNLAEFAVQGRACIVIPSPYLTGGHQIKNAQYLQDNSAAVVISESDIEADPNRLAKQVSELLKNNDKRQLLASSLTKYANPNAARDIATLLVDQVKVGQQDSNGV